MELNPNKTTLSDSSVNRINNKNPLALVPQQVSEPPPRQRRQAFPLGVHSEQQITNRNLEPLAPRVSEQPNLKPTRPLGLDNPNSNRQVAFSDKPKINLPGLVPHLVKLQLHRLLVGPPPERHLELGEVSEPTRLGVYSTTMLKNLVDFSAAGARLDLVVPHRLVAASEPEIRPPVLAEVLEEALEQGPIPLSTSTVTLLVDLVPEVVYWDLPINKSSLPNNLRLFKVNWHL